MTDASGEVPSGWYPQADGEQRYWDGLAWTHHVKPPAAADRRDYDNALADAVADGAHIEYQGTDRAVFTVRARPGGPTILIVVFVVLLMGLLALAAAAAGIYLIVGILIVATLWSGLRTKVTRWELRATESGEITQQIVGRA